MQKTAASVKATCVRVKLHNSRSIDPESSLTASYIFRFGGSTGKLKISGPRRTFRVGEVVTIEVKKEENDGG